MHPAVWMFLLLFGSMGCAWRCNEEHSFTVATYANKAEELNENPELFFPSLRTIPRLVLSENQPDAHIHIDESGQRRPKIVLEAEHQQVKMQIPIMVRASSSSSSSMHHFRCKKKFTEMVDCSCWHLFGCPQCPELHTYYTKCSCEGEISVQHQAILQAVVRLRSNDLQWLQPVKQSTSKGKCAHIDSQISHFNPQESLEQVQNAIRKKWQQDWQFPTDLDLGSGARLFLNFSRPKIQANVLPGSLDACLASEDGTTYQVNPRRTGRPQCDQHRAFQDLKSPPRYDYPNFATTSESGQSSLVFSWTGSSHAKIVVSAGPVTIALEANDAATQMTHLVLTAKVSDMNLNNDSQMWLPSVVKARLQCFLRFVFFGQWGGAPHSVRVQKNETKQQWRAEKSNMWMLVDASTRQVSVGRGSNPGEDELLSVPIGASAKLPTILALSSPGDKARWRVFSGPRKQVCTPGLPKSLTETKQGAVRISTSLLEGLFWTRSHELLDYISNASRSFRDAELFSSLHLGSMALMVTPGPLQPYSSMLRLSFSHARIKTQCSARVKPLFAASVQQVQSAADAVGFQDAAGNLEISVVATNDPAPSLMDFQLLDPRVPLAQVEANYVLSKFVEVMNQKIAKIRLPIPHVLARFIPCHMDDKGQCRNMKMHLLSESAGSYLEFSDNGTAGLAIGFTARPDVVANAQDGRSPERCAWAAILVPFFVSFWLAWQRSLKYFVSVVMGSILCLAWYCDGPFAGFTVLAFSQLGITEGYGPTKVAERMRWWTDVATFLTALGALWPLVQIAWRGFSKKLQSSGLNFSMDSLKSILSSALHAPKSVGSLILDVLLVDEHAVPEHSDLLTHILFSASVCVLQLCCIIVIPLTMHLGKQVGMQAASHSKDVYPSAAIDVIMALMGKSDVEIYSATGTFVSCVFTSLYVSHLGLYLMF